MDTSAAQEESLSLSSVINLSDSLSSVSEETKESIDQESQYLLRLLDEQESCMKHVKSSSILSAHELEKIPNRATNVSSWLGAKVEGTVTHSNHALDEEGGEWLCGKQSLAESKQQTQDFINTVMRHRLRLLTEVAAWFQKTLFQQEFFPKLLAQCDRHEKEMSDTEVSFDTYSDHSTVLSDAAQSMAQLGLELLSRLNKIMLERRTSMKTVPPTILQYLSTDIPTVDELRDRLEVWKKAALAMGEVFEHSKTVPCSETSKLELVLENGAILFSNLTQLCQTQTSSMREYKVSQKIVQKKYEDYMKHVEHTKENVAKAGKHLWDFKDYMSQRVMTQLTEEVIRDRKFKKQLEKLEGKLVDPSASWEDDKLCVLQREVKQYKDLTGILCTEVSSVKNFISFVEGRETCQISSSSLPSTSAFTLPPLENIPSKEYVGREMPDSEICEAKTDGRSSASTTNDEYMATKSASESQTAKPPTSEESSKKPKISRKKSKAARKKSSVQDKECQTMPEAMVDAGAGLSEDVTQLESPADQMQAPGPSREIAEDEVFSGVADAREEKSEGEDFVSEAESISSTPSQRNDDNTEAAVLRKVSYSDEPLDTTGRSEDLKTTLSSEDAKRQKQERPDVLDKEKVDGDINQSQNAATDSPASTCAVSKSALSEPRKQSASKELTDFFLSKKIRRPSGKASTKKRRGSRKAIIKVRSIKSQEADDSHNAKPHSNSSRFDETKPNKKDQAETESELSNQVETKSGRTIQATKKSIQIQRVTEESKQSKRVTEKSIRARKITDESNRTGVTADESIQNGRATTQSVHTFLESSEIQQATTEPRRKFSEQNRSCNANPKGTKSDQSSPESELYDPITSQTGENQQTGAISVGPPPNSPEPTEGDQHPQEQIDNPGFTSKGRLSQEEENIAMEDKPVQNSAQEQAESRKQNVIEDSSALTAAFQYGGDSPYVGFINRETETRLTKEECYSRRREWLQEGVECGVRHFAELRDTTAEKLKRCYERDQGQALQNLNRCDLQDTQQIGDVLDHLKEVIEPTFQEFESLFASAVTELKQNEERVKSKRIVEGLPSGIDTWSATNEKLKVKELDYSTSAGCYNTLWNLYNRVRAEMSTEVSQRISVTPSRSVQPTVVIPAIPEDIEGEKKEEEEEKHVPIISDAMPTVLSCMPKTEEKFEGHMPKYWKEELDLAKEAFDEGAIPYQEYTEQIMMCLKMAALLQLKSDSLGNTYPELRLKQVFAYRIRSILNEVHVGKSKLRELQEKAGISEYSNMMAGMDKMEKDLRIEHEQTIIAVSMAQAHKRIRSMMRQRMYNAMETIEERSEPSSVSSRELSSSEEEESDTELKLQQAEDKKHSFDLAKDVQTRDKTEEEPSSERSSPDISQEFLERVASSIRDFSRKMSVPMASSQSGMIDLTDLPAQLMASSIRRPSTAAAHSMESLTELSSSGDESESPSPPPDSGQVGLQEPSLIQQSILLKQPQPPSVLAAVRPCFKTGMALVPLQISKPRPPPAEQVKLSSQLAAAVSSQRKKSLLPFLSGAGTTELVQVDSADILAVSTLGIDSVVTSVPKCSEIKVCLKTERPTDEREPSVSSRKPLVSPKRSYGPLSFPSVVVQPISSLRRKRTKSEMAVPSSVRPESESPVPRYISDITLPPLHPIVPTSKVSVQSTVSPYPSGVFSSQQMGYLSEATSSTISGISPQPCASAAAHYDLLTPSVSTHLPPIHSPGDEESADHSRPVSRKASPRRRESALVETEDSAAERLFSSQVDKALTRHDEKQHVTTKYVSLGESVPQPSSPSPSLAVEIVRDWVYAQTLHPPRQVCKFTTPVSPIRQRKRQTKFLRRMAIQKGKVRPRRPSESESISPERTVSAAGELEKQVRKERSGWPTQDVDTKLPILESKLFCLDMDQTRRKAGKILRLVTDCQLSSLRTDSNCQHIWNKFDTSAYRQL